MSQYRRCMRRDCNRLAAAGADWCWQHPSGEGSMTLRRRPTCTVWGCLGRFYKQGYCRGHLRQWLEHGVAGGPLDPVRSLPIAPKQSVSASLGRGNARRVAETAAREVASARAALERAPDLQTRAVLTARVSHPGASHAACGAAIGLSKDAFRHRLHAALGEEVTG